MPLFKRTRVKGNPTIHWIGDTRFALEVDLGLSALSGVRIGDSVDRLNRLGPAEDDAASQQGVYSYFSRGLEIREEQGFVRSFRLVWAGDEGFRPFKGACLLKGKLLPLGSQTDEPSLFRLFGEPYWRDQDDDEILLFFEREEDVEWQIELSRDGALKEWTFCSPPLMADEAQRRAYGVTKPWPPGSPARITPKRFLQSG